MCDSFPLPTIPFHDNVLQGLVKTQGKHRCSLLVVSIRMYSFCPPTSWRVECTEHYLNQMDLAPILCYWVSVLPQGTRNINLTITHRLLQLIINLCVAHKIMENIKQQTEVIVTVMLSHDSRKTLCCILLKFGSDSCVGLPQFFPSSLSYPRELVLSISLDGLLHSVTYGVASK